MQQNSDKKPIFFERIFQIIKYYNIKNVNDFALNYLGYKSSQKINRLKEENTSPSFEILNDISNKFEDISIDWLLTGKGEMLKKQKSPIHIAKEEETRPRIPMDAAAGSMSTAVDSIIMSQCEQLPIIKAFARYDFTIFAKGDSMEPEYHSGDELACLYIRNTNFVQWGRIHVLDTAQGILVKRIFDAGDTILCKSDNKRYQDFNIDKSELYNIALVIGMLRRH